MKQAITLVLLLLCTFAGFSQVDTFCIQGRKFPLRKIKPYYNGLQHARVELPSEYATTGVKEDLGIKCFSNPTSFALQYDNDGNSFVVAMGSLCDTLVTEHHVRNVADTLELIKALDLPFIKANREKHYLCYATIYRIQAGTLTRYDFEGNYDRVNPDFKMEKAEMPAAGATYILTNIYYRKNLATWYLDRSFILKLKKP